MILKQYNTTHRGTLGTVLYQVPKTKALENSAPGPPLARSCEMSHITRPRGDLLDVYKKEELHTPEPPRPLFSSRLKSQHHGFHRHLSLKTLPSGRWLHCLGPAFWYLLRVFTSPSPPLGFLVVVLVAPLVHGRFVSPLPRTSRSTSLSGLHGRKVHLPRQYVS